MLMNETASNMLIKGLFAIGTQNHHQASSKSIKPSTLKIKVQKKNRSSFLLLLFCFSFCSHIVSFPLNIHFKSELKLKHKLHNETVAVNGEQKQNDKPNPPQLIIDHQSSTWSVYIIGSLAI